MEQTPEQRQTEEEWIPVNVDGQQGVVSLDSLLEPPPGCVYSPEAREQLKEQIRRLGIIRITKSPDKSA